MAAHPSLSNTQQRYFPGVRAAVSKRAASQARLAAETAAPPSTHPGQPPAPAFAIHQALAAQSIDSCAGMEEDLYRRQTMRTYTAVVEQDPDTNLYVGYVPGFAGAHSQGATIDELRENLQEVIGMLLEDGEPALEASFVGIQQIAVG